MRNIVTNDIEKQDQEDNGLGLALDRGIYIANGHKFIVKPVYLGEEDDYLNDVPYYIYPKKTDDLDDEKLNQFAMMLFSKKFGGTPEKRGKFENIKRWFVKTFNKKDGYYTNFPKALGLIKWIERKVYYKGKPIKFYDLERKFGLTKVEIVKLFGYFQDLSGF